jgi:hypothetical protein
MEHTAPTLLPLDGQDWRSPTFTEFTERLQPQRCGVQTCGTGLRLSFLDQIPLIFPDVVLAETIRSLAKMTSEAFNKPADSSGPWSESSYDAGVPPASAFVDRSCGPPFGPHSSYS